MKPYWSTYSNLDSIGKPEEFAPKFSQGYCCR